MICINNDDTFELLKIIILFKNIRHIIILNERLPAPKFRKTKPEVNVAMALTAGIVDRVSDIPAPIAAIETTDNGEYFDTKNFV
jgi:hypothetical protein